MPDSLISPPAEPAPIRVLDDAVVNRIAAGEVVERPVAVVKELVENSLDAGASRVDVHFRNGGKSFIRVEDNGFGMAPDEAMLALERHATSKLRSAEDLGRIVSMGFRGEALPSIAAVSRFVLRTRAEGWDHGVEIRVNAGKIQDRREVGMPVGTRIEVQHLFNSVPARRKFLKTDNTEAAHIVHLVRLHAVARSGVSFSLTENDRLIFRSPRCPTLLERVREIWGEQFAAGLAELPERLREKLALHGLISKPGTGRSSRREMITLVNGRPVESRTLLYALTEAYHTFVPKGRFPQAVLHLTIPPDAIDVNVHPAKREIKFRDEPSVRRFFLETILHQLEQISRETARTAKPAPREEKNGSGESAGQSNTRGPGRSANGAGKGSPETKESPRPEPAFRPRTHPRGISDEFRKTYLGSPESKNPGPGQRSSTSGMRAGTDQESSEKNGTAAIDTQRLAKQNGAQDSSDRPADPELTLSWRLVGRLRGGLVLFETERGLLCLRLRAAHERILFERARSFFLSAGAARQQLLFPLKMEFDSLAANALEAHLVFFNERGFDIELFGRQFFRVRALPDWLPEEKAEAFLREAVERLQSGELNPARTEPAAEILAGLAAVRAVRQPDDLPDAAVRQLAHDLMRCAQPLNCPQGRPTFFELSDAELRKRFGL